MTDREKQLAYFIRAETVPRRTETHGARYGVLLGNSIRYVMADCIKNRRPVGKPVLNASGDKRLQPYGRYPLTASLGRVATCYERARDIVAITGTLLDRMRRGHARAGGIEEDPCQHRLGACAVAPPARSHRSLRRLVRN